MPCKPDRCRSGEKKKMTLLNTKETQSDAEKAAVRKFLLSGPERKEEKAR